MNNAEFSKFIKAERKKQCLSQTALAEKSGFSRESINLWEHNKRAISLDNAEKLIKTLGVTLNIGI